MNARSLFLITALLVFVPGCSDDDHGDGDQTLFYRDEMRSLIGGISRYARVTDPGFIIITQNGQDLATIDGAAGSARAGDFVEAIDGQAREELFYGFGGDDQATPADERNQFIVFLDLLKDAGKTILVTDYCYTPQKMDDSWFQNQSRGYISFAADHRELNNIPAYPSPLHQENQDSMAALGDVCNFLYLINPESLTRAELVHAIRNSGYDLVIVDLFAGEEQLTAGDVAAMRQKKQGGSRLVICYMSIGEAEDYRYYWQSSWYSGNPAWLGQENPEWPGNYKVKYWDENWQHILFGNDQSYCKKILDAGFDGVYLDMIDAFEYFEK